MMGATMIQKPVSLGAGWLGAGGNLPGCAVICAHSCRFRHGESFHALVWGEPHSFLHLFIFTIAWTGWWCGEGKSHSLQQLLPGHCLECWGCSNKQNTKFPALVEGFLTFWWKRGEKTQRVPP